MRKKAIRRLLAMMKRDHCTECGGRMFQGECETCGYSLVEQTREKIMETHPRI